MAYGETIIIQTGMKEVILRNLRDCGCDETATEECWNSFVSSVEELQGQLKLARRCGDFSKLSESAAAFLDLVQNLRAADLAIYTKSLCRALKAKELNGIDRAANDLAKICEKYLEPPVEE